MDNGRIPGTGISNSFAGVVSRDSIRIALTHVALLGLPVLGADIRNAYLQAPSSEKHFIICGPEFGIENEGRVALIHRALYGGKVAGRNFLASPPRLHGTTWLYFFPRGSGCLA